MAANGPRHRARPAFPRRGDLLAPERRAHVEHFRRVLHDGQILDVEFENMGPMEPGWCPPRPFAPVMKPHGRSVPSRAGLFTLAFLVASAGALLAGAPRVLSGFIG
ncbi:hypothetical protein [Pararhizobium mangrovi]|uniref:Uncharacterized protein n=1 Tax=Pararhizobium mangrovi TaxID=2590452 RepID=A0A506U2S0_9HYPH|nr:hypothetical protein [Pararhizobium mangrovi]TPW27295.1 hypothetical protein FJU11_12140 [Pararhizobium mangrovi]